MKINEYNQMMSYLTRPAKPETEYEQVAMTGPFIKGGKKVIDKLIKKGKVKKGEAPKTDVEKVQAQKKSFDQTEKELAKSGQIPVKNQTVKSQYKFTGRETEDDLYDLEEKGIITRDDHNVYSPRFLEYLDARVKYYYGYTKGQMNKILNQPARLNYLRAQVSPRWGEATFGDDYTRILEKARGEEINAMNPGQVDKSGPFDHIFEQMYKPVRDDIEKAKDKLPGEDPLPTEKKRTLNAEGGMIDDTITDRAMFSEGTKYLGNGLHEVTLSDGTKSYFGRVMRKGKNIKTKQSKDLDSVKKELEKIKKLPKNKNIIELQGTKEELLKDPKFKKTLKELDKEIKQIEKKGYYNIARVRDKYAKGLGYYQVEEIKKRLQNLTDKVHTVNPNLEKAMDEYVEITKDGPPKRGEVAKLVRKHKVSNTGTLYRGLRTVDLVKKQPTNSDLVKSTKARALKEIQKQFTNLPYEETRGKYRIKGTNTVNLSHLDDKYSQYVTANNLGYATSEINQELLKPFDDAMHKIYLERADLLDKKPVGYEDQIERLNQLGIDLSSRSQGYKNFTILQPDGTTQVFGVDASKTIDPAGLIEQGKKLQDFSDIDKEIININKGSVFAQAQLPDEDEVAELKKQSKNLEDLLMKTADDNLPMDQRLSGLKNLQISTDDILKNVAEGSDKFKNMRGSIDPQLLGVPQIAEGIEKYGIPAVKKAAPYLKTGIKTGTKVLGIEGAASLPFLGLDTYFGTRPEDVIPNIFTLGQYELRQLAPGSPRRAEFAAKLGYGNEYLSATKKMKDAVTMYGGVKDKETLYELIEKNPNINLTDEEKYAFEVAGGSKFDAYEQIRAEQQAQSYDQVKLPKSIEESKDPFNFLIGKPAYKIASEYFQPGKYDTPRYDFAQGGIASMRLNFKIGGDPKDKKKTTPALDKPTIQIDPNAPTDPGRRDFMEKGAGLGALGVGLATGAVKFAPEIKKAVTGVTSQIDQVPNIVNELYFTIKNFGKQTDYPKPGSDTVKYEFGPYKMEEGPGGYNITKTTDSDYRYQEEYFEVYRDPETGVIEYEELTVRPDSDGKLKDVDYGVELDSYREIGEDLAKIRGDDSLIKIADEDIVKQIEKEEAYKRSLQKKGTGEND